MPDIRTLEMESDRHKGIGENTAGALESAAGKMHQTADAGAQKLSGALHSAARGIESSATYLREHDTKRILADVEGLIRKRPGQSLLIAAALGFLLGCTLRRD
jgi:ElaB/YqjD/DUF883 family membrane-anchored ribosome-binding protein